MHGQGPPPFMGWVGHHPLPVDNIGTVAVSGAHILGLVCWQRPLLVCLFLLAGGFPSWPALYREYCITPVKCGATFV